MKRRRSKDSHREKEKGEEWRSWSRRRKRRRGEEEMKGMEKKEKTRKGFTAGPPLSHC